MDIILNKKLVLLIFFIPIYSFSQTIDTTQALKEIKEHYVEITNNLEKYEVTYNKRVSEESNYFEETSIFHNNSDTVLIKINDMFDEGGVFEIRTFEVYLLKSKPIFYFKKEYVSQGKYKETRAYINNNQIIKLLYKDQEMDLYTQEQFNDTNINNIKNQSLEITNEIKIKLLNEIKNVLY